MSRVFVIIDQKHKDRITGEFVSRFDFSSAAEYGELIFLLASNAIARDPQVNADLAEALDDVTDDDYILPVGSPLLILLTGLYAGMNEELTKLNILEWERDRTDRTQGRYIPTTLPIL